ncbi:MAG: IS6 family transposase, partial [Hyphomicrobiales bacterium]|nr:IS6 family transposase [Hyphomicrobiales bacterium]
MSNPFRYFNSSPEVIRLVVMMYVRYPLSLRNVEDLLAERGIDISHETIRFWWNRFGPMFAAEIRKRRVSNMRGFPQWRWHLDEVFVKINGKLCYLWRAVDHERRSFGNRGHREAGQDCRAEVSEANHEEIWPSAERRHRRAFLLSCGDERDRQRPSPRD